jgi:prolipoprotein diacylglyceryltransferase
MIFYRFIILGHGWVLSDFRLVFLIGQALAWAWMAWRLGRLGVPAWRVALFPLFAVFPFVEGANLGSWLLHGRPLGFLLYGGIFGALVGGAVAWRVLYRTWIAGRRWFDEAMVGLFLVIMMSRVGCHLSGCCHGTQAPDGWPSVTYNPTLPDVSPLPIFRGIPLHPAAAYESLGAGLLLGAAALLRGRLRPGEQGWLLLGAYAGLRFALEFIRADPRGGALFGLYPSQLISLALLAVTALAVWTERRPEPQG